MNKLNKIGVSALCGSLAAMSAAQAGDLTASGSAALTYISQEAVVTGNPIGMASAVTSSGTSETYTLTVKDNDECSLGAGWD